MSRIGEPAGNRTSSDVFHGHVDPARAHHDVLRGLDGKQVCPFCGSVSEKTATPCARCGMDNTPEARKATKARIGPWYVLQARNPAAPGMRFETLLSFVRKGRVRARSVVRGPTTHQLWRFAAHVKGLSREFGLCFSCGSALDSIANICPQCNRLQEPPLNPDTLLEDGEEGSGRPPIYRELPAPAPEQQAAPPEPTPEEADFVIPALGGFAAAEASAAKPAPAPETAAPPAFAQPPSPAFKGNIEPLPDLSIPSASKRSSPPVGPSPFAMGAPTPRKENGGGGGFLTAKELAAAFRLSFDPSATMDAVDIPDDGMPAGVLPDGMPAGSMMSHPAPSRLPTPNPASLRPPKRRRGAFAKFVLFVLILAGTGFAVLMWVDPGFRQRTIDWCKATAGKIQNYGKGAESPSSIVAPPGTSKGESESLEVPDPPEPSGVKTETRSVTTESSGSADSDVVPAPAIPAASSDKPDVPVEKTPAPAKPAPKAQPVKVQEEPRTAPPESETELKARLKSLRDAARDAEGKRDYKAALKIWQDISELPPEYRDTRYKSKITWLSEQVKLDQGK